MPNPTVPSSAREQWTRTFTRTVEDVLAAIQTGAEQGILDAFSSLLRLPALAFTDSRSSRGRARRARIRLQRIDAGQEVFDVAADAHTAERPDQHVRHAQAARAHRNLTLGNISRAARSLEALPIAEPTAANVAALRALHPPAPPPVIPACAVAAVTVTLEHLSDVLRRLPKGSAPGPSGWTYEHIKAATHAGGPPRTAVLGLVNAIVGGNLPHVPALLDSRLIGLEKPGNRGLRPIAIGEVWFRLAGLCAMAARPGAGNALAPLQLGVGVQGGTHAIGHALATGIAADPDCVTIQLDFENAFNAVSRDAMLAAVAERQPTILPFAAWVYRQPSRLLVDGAPADLPPIESQCGVRQGDPIAGLYFALTVQGPLEALHHAHPAAKPVALHDDGFLQGSPDAVIPAFHAVRANAATIGLNARLDKCAVYSPNQQAAADTAAALGIQHSVHGITAAGTPIGTDAFVTAHATTSADSASRTIDIILESGLPTQDKFILLHSSAQMKLAHLPRVSQWQLISADVTRIEDKVAQAAFELMQRPVQADLCAGQLTLPLRFGGMGVRRTTQLEASAAFLSAAAMTETTMRQGPAEYRPFSGPNALSLTHDWQVLHAAGAEHTPPAWAPEALAIDEASIDEILPGAQRAYARSAAKHKYDALLASFATDDPLHVRALARLHSCACGHASMWLTTLPLCPALTLSNSDFQTAMRLRLGLMHMPANAPDVDCFCGRRLLPAEYDHAMTCSKLGGSMTMRHDLLSENWRRLGTRAGIASSREPTVRMLQGAQDAPRIRTDSRGDALFAMEGELTVVDISVVHPAAASFARSGRAPGGAAAKRDAEKRAKYRTADPHGYNFTPLSHETFGRLGKPAMQLLNSFATFAAESGVHKEAFVINALRELSVTLCKGNGLLFRRGLMRMATSSGTNFRAGSTVPTADVP